MFFNTRLEPSKQPSFVNPISKAASLMIGWSFCNPTIDHVPQLINAVCLRSASFSGNAIKAAAVS